MSRHSYSRVWLHLVWGTKHHLPLLPKPAAVQVCAFLRGYASAQEIYMSIAYVNPDHVHVLIDLPVQRSIAETVQILKGASSHYINHSDLIPGKFAWGRGYGAFSVSHSDHGRVARYIARQEAHHRQKAFIDEYQGFIERYGLRWYDDA